MIAGSFSALRALRAASSSVDLVSGGDHHIDIAGRPDITVEADRDRSDDNEIDAVLDQGGQHALRVEPVSQGAGLLAGP